MTELSFLILTAVFAFWLYSDKVRCELEESQSRCTAAQANFRYRWLRAPDRCKVHAWRIWSNQPAAQSDSKFIQGGQSREHARADVNSRDSEREAGKWKHKRMERAVAETDTTAHSILKTRTSRRAAPCAVRASCLVFHLRSCGCA